MRMLEAISTWGLKAIDYVFRIIVEVRLRGKDGARRGGGVKYTAMMLRNMTWRGLGWWWLSRVACGLDRFFCLLSKRWDDAVFGMRDGHVAGSSL